MTWEYKLYSTIKAPKSTPIHPIGLIKGMFDASIYKLCSIWTNCAVLHNELSIIGEDAVLRERSFFAQVFRFHR